MRDKNTYNIIVYITIASGVRKEVVGSEGLEPPTSSTSMKRSSQLSYEPPLSAGVMIEQLTSENKIYELLLAY